jgi:serine/threonine protein kinase
MSEELLERFVREVRTVGQLQTPPPHIVVIFDVGEDEGQPFIAMEYVPSETLAHQIDRREPNALGRRLELAEQLWAGLAYAHAAGIIHRDIEARQPHGAS